MECTAAHGTGQNSDWLSFAGSVKIMESHLKVMKGRARHEEEEEVESVRGVPCDGFLLLSD